MNTKLWVVSGPHPTGGLSAREWVMDGNRVKFFKSEKAAIEKCKQLNKYI
jgi:hypothetical protein